MDKETYCPICDGNLIETNGKWICSDEPDRHIYAFYGDDPHPKLEISREVAIQYIKDELYYTDDEGYDTPDFDNMTNEEIGAEMCLSGMIHDAHFGRVT